MTPKDIRLPVPLVGKPLLPTPPVVDRIQQLLSALLEAQQETNWLLKTAVNLYVERTAGADAAGK